MPTQLKEHDNEDLLATKVTNSTKLAIKVNNLSHCYQAGDKQTSILSNACLTVEPGESVALIGRSGSGKSTLLNLISGLEPIQTGEVWLDGQAISKMNDHDRTRQRGRDIGFIYQSFNLIPTLSIGDNITLPLALSGIKAAEQHTRLSHILEAVDLKQRARDFPDQLSGGEQQRVAIARALIHRPALILADEPTGNLDAQSGRQVLGLLSDLVKRGQSALLLVTHSVEVARVSDRVLTLNNTCISSMSQESLTGSSAW